MIAWRIRQLDVTASTNDDARTYAEAGEDEGLVVHALRQTAGRGRHGRQWNSPIGNLYCSVLLRPDTDMALGLYSFVAALAVYDTVHELLPGTIVRLKWPNDVLLEGAKIAGILLESGEGYLIVGIGLNIDHYPEAAQFRATSIAAHGGRTSVDSVLALLLQKLDKRYAQASVGGFTPVRQAWLSRAMEGAMTVKLPQGVLQGEFVNLDTDGQLILRLADGSEKAIATGDVFPTSG